MYGSMRRRRVHVFALVSALVGVFTAMSVSPAAAATPRKAPTGAYCGVAKPSIFSSASRLTAGASISREPGAADAPVEVPASANGKGGANFKATVDVYFHVISDGAVGNVSSQAITDQMTVLNMGFGGFEGGVNTGFRFRLAAVDRTSNAAWFNAKAGSPDERAMKKALHRGDASDLNIYTSTAEDYLGWAYFPSSYKVHPEIDGIIIDWESLPGTSSRYAGAYDLGKTATHEAGHWAGLYHVFQGGCNNWGDHVDDTPAQLVATRGCPVGQDSCKEPGLDSIHNYMDYSFDSCYNQFTLGQTARMQDQWLYYRANGGTTVGQ